MAGDSWHPGGAVPPAPIRDDEARHGVTTLRDFLRIAWRRKVILIICVMVTPLAAAFFSIRQPDTFEASAKVLLKRTDVASSVGRVTDPTLATDPERDAQTQAIVARDPKILVAAAKDLGRTGPDAAGDLFDRSAVATEEGTDILRFVVSGEDPDAIVDEVNAYAEQYTEYRSQLDTREIKQTLEDAQKQIASLPDTPATQGILESLKAQRDTLTTMLSLFSARATVVKEAGSAVKTGPNPQRDVLMGLALGLLLGFGLAFLIEALDTRVRTGDEIAERLGLPLLGRVPEPPKSVRSHDGLVMLDEPGSPRSEVFRVLRTNIEFADLEHQVRMLMITSAVESEGKSTTVANLAVAMARAGRRVCLVDLDLRRPYIANFFGLVGAAGLTDVALGHIALDRALHGIAVTEGGPRPVGAAGVATDAVLDVLPAGPLPPNPGEFIESQALAAILQDLRVRYDIVLVDAPPMLSVGDPLALSSRVDAMVLIARMNVFRRPMANEIRRATAAVRARVLGVIVTGAEADDGYGYGYGYGHTSGHSVREAEHV